MVGPFDFNGIGNELASVITGNDGKNTLLGLDRTDKLFSPNGNDILNGGAAKDLVVGGRGRDVMSGGSSADIFDFNNINESGKTGSTRDVINDFKRNSDDIHLKMIDARTDVGGNTKFAFIRFQGFSGTSGELPLKDTDPHIVVQADRNGDGRSDFEILVKNVANFKATDFVL